MSDEYTPPLDLELSFHPGESGGYLVDLCFDDPKSAASTKLAVGIPIKINLATLLAVSHDLEAYSEQLSTMLFSDQRMRESWATAWGYALHGATLLRIRLSIEISDSQLHGVRWELLKHPQTQRLLATDERLLLSRYLSSPDAAPVRRKQRESLRSLIFVASPSDVDHYGLAPIDTTAEVQQVQVALRMLPPDVLVGGGNDRKASLTNLVQAMRDGYDILYLVAHGGRYQGQGTPFIFLERADGTADPVLATNLVSALSQLRQLPTLIVLMSCQSAGDESVAAIDALGPQLLLAGIPAVLAMRGNISMIAGATMLPVFVRELQRDGQIDRALSAARAAANALPDWWRPVLYTRLRDGRIWDDDNAQQPWLNDPLGERRISVAPGQVDTGIAEPFTVGAPTEGGGETGLPMESLRYQLRAATERYDLIRERIAEYARSDDVPLQLTKNERRAATYIVGLRHELAVVENDQLRTILINVASGGRRLLGSLPASAPAMPQLQALLKKLQANLYTLAAQRTDKQLEREAILGMLDRVAQQRQGASFGDLCGMHDLLLRTPLAAALATSTTRQVHAEQWQSRSVRTGIGALIDLMHDPRVREIVATFNADFTSAREGMRTLIYYKDLHDQLHTLQYKCYNPIVRDARNFLSDDLVRESMGDYAMTVREIIRALFDIVAGVEPPVAPPDWFADLEKSSVCLQTAIRKRDPQQLHLTILQIDRVLSTQPVYINANLIATARTLPLSSLINTLRLLYRHLVGLDIDQIKLSQFENGIEALSTISQTFNRLLAEHDAWQAIERDLRRLEFSLRYDITEIEIFWDDLRTKVMRLYQSHATEWAIALHEDEQHLHTALKTHEPQVIKDAFLRYRRQASDRFFRVDTDVKRQCDRLREIGDPFSNLMRMTETQPSI